jgi:hypothetical protein
VNSNIVCHAGTPTTAHVLAQIVQRHRQELTEEEVGKLEKQRRDGTREQRAQTEVNARNLHADEIFMRRGWCDPPTTMTQRAECAKAATFLKALKGNMLIKKVVSAGDCSAGFLSVGPWPPARSLSSAPSRHNVHT